MPSPLELRIICPVYNETAQCLRELVEEWEPALDKHVPGWEWVFIDDGSKKEETVRALEALVRAKSKFKCRRIENSGHGQACVFGYREYYKNTRWLLQIDSDRQCRPEDFEAVWSARQEGFHQFGVRRTRDDGRLRIVLSLCVRLYLWMKTGVYHPDPNCPYRLLWCEKLGPSLERIPYALANIALSLRVIRDTRFTNIGFRERAHGQSFHNVRSTLRALRQLSDAVS